eukprot:5523052-Alexandrium_andersonii.AAC.1
MTLRARRWPPAPPTASQSESSLWQKISKVSELEPGGWPERAAGPPPGCPGARGAVPGAAAFKEAVKV